MTTKKNKVGKRLDKDRIKLRTGESQRKNGTYDYRWTTPDGKRHTIYATTLDELREKEEAVICDKRDGIRVETKRITVNDMFELWCTLKRGLKDNTFQNYIYMYNMFVRPGFGRYKIAAVKKTDVKRFYNSMADEKILKISTMETVHNVLHQVFDMAMNDGIIRLNPTEGMLKELKQAHNFHREKRKALTIPEQELFIDFLQRNPMYNHWYPVFAIMLGTGMRVGEIVGLRWCDIDLEEGSININHTLVYYNRGGEKKCSFAINTPKTAAGERTIPMMDFVKEAFLQEKKFQEENGIKCLVSIDGYTDFIFVNRYGATQHQGTLNKAIRRIIRDCNDEVLTRYRGKDDPVLLPPFSCHSLRHTFTTRLCEAGVNVKVIQDVLGHADISTIMDIYVDVTKELKQKEFHDLGDYFGQKSGLRQFTPNLTPAAT